MVINSSSLYKPVLSLTGHPILDLQQHSNISSNSFVAPGASLSTNPFCLPSSGAAGGGGGTAVAPYWSPALIASATNHILKSDVEMSKIGVEISEEKLQGMEQFVCSSQEAVDGLALSNESHDVPITVSQKMKALLIHFFFVNNRL